MNKVQKATPPEPRPFLPMHINQMADHHLSRMKGLSFAEACAHPTMTVHASFDGFYGVLDFGVVQITGGARWDQLFGRNK